MSNNNDSGKFFKFKNLQLSRKQNPARQTRQNTDLRTQGTAEEQFAAITAAARADAAAICRPSEQYRVRSHLRRRRHYFMYNQLDDIGEITQYKR